MEIIFEDMFDIKMCERFLLLWKLRESIMFRHQF